MKGVAITLISASIANIASGFVPAPMGVPRSSQLRMLPDAELLHHLALYGNEAARVVVQECDHQECVTVEAMKNAHGGWDFQSAGLPSSQNTNWKILMMEMDDTE